MVMRSIVVFVWSYPVVNAWSLEAVRGLDGSIATVGRASV